MNLRLTSKLTVFTTFFLLICSTLMIGQDTIPFTLGDDNRIYLKVSINDSEPLDFIFDTGANAMVANTSRIEQKVRLTYNATTQNRSANAVQARRVSSGNEIQIGPFLRGNEDLVGIPYPENYTFDGVIGYPFFADYYLEIDYKSQKLIIHRSRPRKEVLSDYRKKALTFIGDVPFMEIGILHEKRPMKFNAMIDTGYNGELIVYYPVVMEYRLFDKFQKIGEASSVGAGGKEVNSDCIILPQTDVGGFLLEGLPAYLHRAETNSPFPAILGGNALKRFHWIIHIREETVYFKPNELLAKGFR